MPDGPPQSIQNRGRRWGCNLVDLVSVEASLQLLLVGDVIPTQQEDRQVGIVLVNSFDDVPAGGVDGFQIGHDGVDPAPGVEHSMEVLDRDCIQYS